jgi:hypothetical protein
MKGENERGKPRPKPQGDLRQQRVSQQQPVRTKKRKKKWVLPDPTGGIPDAWLPPSYFD